MKFSIYKASGGRNLDKFGTLEASCMEIAGDLLYKVLRRSPGRKDGDLFVIVPHSDEPLADSLLEEGSSFHIVQYREID
ncbi:hypothetical protein DRW41_09185 [Neobacillus piezotolerans]|uniref:Uncharacterized protein n=1 Tax=Neobacillus piezotolerans TaxID=2259171 RepID=A0A3D8GR12_9BACI|nr:hypothetical protein [Neobacillus piezotolerans]RDU36868.1 hypothetical protein DRW41_09185 [Neobacillus piezotolerans]